MAEAVHPARAGAVLGLRGRALGAAARRLVGRLKVNDQDGNPIERKAAMVSNLLVVLCADREVQPVVNTGTLYQ